MEDNKHVNCESDIYEMLQIIFNKVNDINLRVHKEYTEENLKQVQSEIEKYKEKALKLHQELILKEDQANNYSIISEICKEIRNCEMNQTPEDKDQLLENLLDAFNRLTYSFHTAHQEIETTITENDSMNMIQLCKNVRTMEDLINKICSNNIDKSIIGGEKHFDSMRLGFIWLFCHDDVNKRTSYQRVDIRDRNRYLDYIKYQIMVACKNINHRTVLGNSETEELYRQLQDVFDKMPFEEKIKSITEFKENVKKLITCFFSVYEILTKYRDALFREEEIRKSVSPYSETPSVPSDIVILSSVAVRVLLDRFVSFVKISDLNFGNSTFNRAWFNYSELSKSNYAGSSFKSARIENAKVIDCDVSTSNLTMADGSGTDFSNSNFDYSNLAGMNLREATVNRCQFHRALFRDPNLDRYKHAITLPDAQKQKRNKRCEALYDRWNAASQLVDVDCINGIKEQFLQIVSPDIQINSEIGPEDNVRILDCDFGKNEGEILSSIQHIIAHPLATHISKELLWYISQIVASEGTKKKADREKKHGKVLLEAADLNSVSAKEATMKEADLCHVNMQNASFEQADMSGATLFYSTAKGSSFMYTNLNFVSCFESDFSEANFSSAIMNGAQYVNCNLNNTNWNKAILIGTEFVDVSDYVENVIINEKTSTLKVKLKECIDFCSDKLIQDTPKTLIMKNKESNEYWQKNCTMNSAIMTETLADNATFFNLVSYSSTFNEASIKNGFFANCRMYLSDFINTDLRYSNFICTSFGQSNLSAANMTMARLKYVDFSNANLTKLLLNLAELNHVLFGSANLFGLNLSNALIKNCAFRDCKFELVNLTGATFVNCIFEEVQFLSVVGVHSCAFENCYVYNCTNNKDNKINTIEDIK